MDSEIQRNKVLIRWQKVHSEILDHMKKNYQNTKIYKARILGFLAGDGCITIRKNKNSRKINYEVRFFPDDESLIRSYVDAFERCYGITPKIHKRKNYYSVRCYSKIVVQDIYKSAKLRTYDWRIPNLTTDDEKIEWVKAFFDSEGFFSKKHIRVQTVNKLGMKDLSKLLSEFDIEHKFYTYIPKKKGWNEVFIITITKKEQRLKFLNKIGSNHIKKLKVLKDSCLDAKIA